MAIAEIRGLDHAVQGAAKGVQGFIGAIPPRPKPCRVDVGVPNDVEDLSFGVRVIGNSFCEYRQSRDCAQRSRTLNKKLPPRNSLELLSHLESPLDFPC